MMSQNELKNKMPLVSILIPNYNYGDTVCETIDSALGQTYNNIEIIILDNGSTDDSWKKIKNYRSKGCYIYRNRKNIGVGSHNQLLSFARGKYVQLLHSDDIIEPTFIEECVRLMEKNPNVGLTFTERIEIDGEGNDLNTATPFYNCSCIIPGENQKTVLIMASYYVPSQTLYRRETIERAGLYTISSNNFMDWHLLYKCCCIADVGCIHKKLCRYRMWGESQTGYMTKEMLMPIRGYIQRYNILVNEIGNEKVREREKMAKYKQADLTLKLGTDVIRDGDYEKGKRYLELARSFSLDITESPLYIAIDEYLRDKSIHSVNIKEYLIDKGLAGARVVSYDPPDGYISYLDE